MTERREPSQAPAKAGYKSPPVDTQFKKGISGNPNGRPRKTAAANTASALGLSVDTQSMFDDVLRREAQRVVTITDTSGTHKMTMAEVAARAMLTSAAKGSVFAQRETFQNLQALEARDAQRARLKAEQEEAERQQEIRVYNYVVQLKSDQTKIWAEAESQGKEPEQPWPHPDDIMLNPQNHTWNVRGPMDAKDVPYYEAVRADRDYLFADAFLCSENSKENPNYMMKITTLLWMQQDIMLPKRWQIFDTFEKHWLALFYLPFGHLKKIVSERKILATTLNKAQGRRASLTKDQEKEATVQHKPLLKMLGYRSFAELDAAVNAHDDRASAVAAKSRKRASVKKQKLC
jgi:Family of unknown function (DUF5681)